MDDDVISSGVGMAMNDNATTVTEGALERARMLEAARKKVLSILCILLFATTTTTYPILTTNAFVVEKVSG